MTQPHQTNPREAKLSPGERRDLQNRFWKEVHGRLNLAGVVYRDKERSLSQKNNPHVYEVHFGSQFGFLSCIVDSRKSIIRLRLYLPKAPDSHRIFKALLRQRRQIEEELDLDHLTWEPPKNSAGQLQRGQVLAERLISHFEHLCNDQNIDWMTHAIVRFYFAFKWRLLRLV